MVVAYTPGQTVDAMKVSMSTIKKKDSVYIHGLMADGMKGNGRTGSSMGKANSLMLKAKAKWEYGKMVTGPNGWRKRIIPEVQWCRIVLGSIIMGYLALKMKVWLKICFDSRDIYLNQASVLFIIKLSS